MQELTNTIANAVAKGYHVEFKPYVDESTPQSIDITIKRNNSLIWTNTIDPPKINELSIEYEMDAIAYMISEAISLYEFPPPAPTPAPEPNVNCGDKPNA